MKICICDDQEVFRLLAKKICEEYFEENGITAEIILCKDGSEVLDIVTEIEILVLDIQMPQMDGITLKNQIEKRMLNPYIIFVTGYDGQMQEAFGRNVIGFVSKMDMDKQLAVYLENAVRLIEKDILIQGKYHSRQIAWFHVEKEYIKVHEWNGKEYLLRESLADLETLLEVAGFVRTHRSWLVNLSYVERFDRMKLIVAQTEVPVSVRSKKKVKDAYWDHIGSL